MELLSFAFAGGGFILIGALESLGASSTSNPDSKTKKNHRSPFFISIAIFSSFIILNSLVSIFDAHKSNDAVGTALQFQVLAIALIFLLYSVLALLVPLPSRLLGMVVAFGFAEEFLLFYLQRKDPSGVENRYYDLLLVPIGVCVFSTVLELVSSQETNNVAKLSRGVGLNLQGTWFVQMGFSLFSNWVAEGCSLHGVSRGNYTLRCKGHPEYHRARAIATLQFNCHLALMVMVMVASYSVFCGRNGGPVHPEASRYTPLGAEMQSLENSATFTLDSDDEDIKDGNVGSQKGVVVVEHGMNGNATNH
ncbi:uncharacterized protein LOC130722807 [Lotus japonicus]|uniref:uncharacterized protein LOC130722807 n=1 Tax=Lotus japonicus TaxID=34305 RepID=UPI002587BDDB|nr:uncharacterized protein LOC130722807 [Lotus japonicus]